MARNRKVVTECGSELERADHGQAAELGDKPLIVLSSPATSAISEPLASLSTKGVSIVVPDTGHLIMIDQPQAVVNATLQVVTDARKRAKM